jgi:flagellar basal body-associated protein FliL
MKEVLIQENKSRKGLYLFILVCIFVLVGVLIFLYFSIYSQTSLKDKVFASENSVVSSQNLDSSLDVNLNENLSLGEEELELLVENPPEFEEYSPEFLPEGLDENVGDFEG